MARKTENLTPQILAENPEYRLTCWTANTGFQTVTYVLRKKRAGSHGSKKLVESAWIKPFTDFDEAIEFADGVGLRIKAPKAQAPA